jgi:hypothetical protein
MKRIITLLTKQLGNCLASPVPQCLAMLGLRKKSLLTVLALMIEVDWRINRSNAFIPTNTDESILLVLSL